MKKCCSDEDIEYGSDAEVSEDLTVNDMNRNHDALSNTIKHYILTNELQSVSQLTPVTIREIIQEKLTENGFCMETFYMNTTSFSIYKFFFEISEDEKNEFINYCITQLR
jgi:hypothetical protein